LPLNNKKHEKKTPNYKKLFKFTPKIVSNEFSLWIGNNDTGFARVGVIVTKKNIKKAVFRNRSKRFAKEIFRNVKQNFINKDVVVVIKQFDNQSLSRWKKKLQELFLWLEEQTIYCSRT